MATLHVGCCITAHGFGHAARAMAVMEALSHLADIKLTVASQVPEWFLRGSYSGPLEFFPLQTDVGLVQQTPLEADIPATLFELSNFYPLRIDAIKALASVFSECSIVVCDISPAGILAAHAAGIPSVLMENFTWDWIYEEYANMYPELKPYISYLRKIYEQVDYRIQAVPVCKKVKCDLQVPPIARACRESREQIRQSLQVDDDTQMVLVSMGGIGLGQLPLEKIRKNRNTVFAVSGYSGKKVNMPHMRFLASDSKFFHPDLVAASDAVIGKVGYSTLAEVYHADVPFGFVSRRDFRESEALVSFIQDKMSGIEIGQQSFWQGNWVDILPQLLSLGKSRKVRQNGSIHCAQFLLSVVGKRGKETGSA